MFKKIRAISAIMFLLLITSMAFPSIHHPLAIKSKGHHSSHKKLLVKSLTTISLLTIPAPAASVSVFKTLSFQQQPISNLQLTMLAAGTVISSSTTTYSPAQQTPFSVKGITVDMVVSAGNGGNGLKLVLQGQDAGGNWYTLPVTMTAVTSTGTWAIGYGPGWTSTGQSVGWAGAGYLPPTWRVGVVSTDATSCTLGVWASLSM